MDRYMTFDVHVSVLSKKVIGTLMHIYRISLSLEKRTRIIVVQSLVLSIINHYISIWGTTNAALLSNIQNVELRSVMMVDSSYLCGDIANTPSLLVFYFSSITKTAARGQYTIRDHSFKSVI